MLPSHIAQYLPFVGILCLFFGLVFSVISVIDYPAKNDMKDLRNYRDFSRYKNLSYAFILIGGFLLLGPNNKL